jgi:hypothetical protein
VLGTVRELTRRSACSDACVANVAVDVSPNPIFTNSLESRCAPPSTSTLLQAAVDVARRERLQVAVDLAALEPRHSVVALAELPAS